MAHKSADGDTVIVDGSLLEGGGQILRISAALSALLCKNIKVIKIRAGRKKSGLAAQHLCGLQLVTQLTNGHLAGGDLGSQEIDLYPGGAAKPDTYSINIKTAGSVCLLVQAAMPPLLFSGGVSTLKLTGGTDADFAPPVNHFILCLEPLMKKLFNISFETTVVRRGYFPKGGGIIEVSVPSLPGGEQLSSFDLTDAGHVTSFRIHSFVSTDLPIAIAHKIGAAAEKLLQQKHFPTVDIQVISTHETSIGSGSGLSVVAETSTGCILVNSAIGGRDKSAIQMATEAVESLLEDVSCGSCVDRHTQDQLIILMALAAGHSKLRTSELTLHTKTAIHIVQLLSSAQFKLTEETANSCVIECEGIGLKANNP